MIIFILIISILLILLVVQHLHCRQLKQKIALLEAASHTPSVEQAPILSPIPEESTKELPIEKGKETNKYKLLVIEDHKDIQLYLKVLFGKEYEFHLAENGEEGLKKAQDIMPDLIITDIMMPVMDGFECTRLLKEDITTCHIPIIQLTALSDDHNAIKGMELGADDYIIKPFSPEVLRTKVKRLIKSRSDLKDFYTHLLLPSNEGNNPHETNEEITLKKLEERDPFISKLLQIVDKNILNKDLNTKNLADEMSVSLPTLYRKVKQSTGFTVVEIIRSARIKKASDMLKEHTHTVAEAAEAVGYNDLYTFRKHFVEIYGIKPSEFYRDIERDE